MVDPSAELEHLSNQEMVDKIRQMKAKLHKIQGEQSMYSDPSNNDPRHYTPSDDQQSQSSQE